ncbi:Imm1 family immunity protein [Micromonospora sp. NPDC048930]|uniref:Imm1 family immunity protein n=1 Tax=Micromonospora sp. NPDC048930 TaxID=3364261 RepID=UPI00371634AC
MTNGPADQPTLRIDIDIDVEADRAAVRWLPDGSYAVDLDPDAPITVYESPDTGLLDIPADLARVNTATAREVILEYVATGRCPARVSWKHEEQHAS